MSSSGAPSLPLRLPHHTHAEKSHGHNSPRSFWSHTATHEINAKATFDSHWRHPSEGGSIAIHSDVQAKDVIELPELRHNRGGLDFEARYPGQHLPEYDSRQGRPRSHPNFQQRRHMMGSLRDEFYQQQETEFKAHTHKVAQEKAKRDELKFKQSISQLQTDRETMVKEIDDMLDLRDRAENRKKEKLYREWQEKVYDNVQKQIISQLDSLPAARYTRSRTTTGNLEETFEKRSIKYDTMKAIDPTRKELNKLDFEKTLRGEAPIGPPRQREVLDPQMWSTLNLEATPHYDRTQKAQTSTKKNARNKTNLVFDHYGAEPPETEAKSTGKRVYPKTSDSQIVL
eukprot:TRINITY_DN2263_c0_g3_i4.p1 TRINITY_DN2263_c0_g3~~TRINITY_DN2263_c0_g3_i4.p1  ORF type:complete len:342 (-),score=64.20 TRINITY_DN2263_c0_g3_i4:853-1878(-)